eukprot:12936340-Prorocentrum_lima.AAC.1
MVLSRGVIGKKRRSNGVAILLRGGLDYSEVSQVGTPKPQPWHSNLNAGKYPAHVAESWPRTSD